MLPRLRRQGLPIMAPPRAKKLVRFRRVGDDVSPGVETLS